MRPGEGGFSWSAAFLVPVFLFSVSADVQAEDATAFFKQNCASCHTIGGGRLVGPDLKDVTRRQPDRKWLAEFIIDPGAKLDGGDPYATKLLNEARGVRMPKIPGVDPDLAGRLLAFIDAGSGRPASDSGETQVSDRPFTAQDVALGRGIFVGETRLVNGGPHCISCHSIVGVEGLGGGRLAPDLTKVFERLGGRKGLGAWLEGPPTATMAPVFKKYPLKRDEEILPLLAFFEYAARQGGVADTSTSTFNFLLIGLGGAVVLLILFDLLWLKRFRAVRKPMILGLDNRGQK
jgi:mono/diheme cytochrome c family protein